MILSITSLNAAEKKIPDPILEIKDGVRGWWIFEDRVIEYMNAEDSLKLLNQKILSLSALSEMYKADIEDLNKFIDEKEKKWTKTQIDMDRLKIINNILLICLLIILSALIGIVCGLVVVYNLDKL